MNTRTWTLIGTGASAVAGIAARKIAEQAWTTLTSDEEVPFKQANPKTSRLFAWAAISAAVMAVASQGARMSLDGVARGTDHHPADD